MFFQIVPEHMPGLPEDPPLIRRRWVYRQGTAKNPGTSICKSATTFTDEATARSNIAEARKAFAGSKFAKVEVE